MGRHYAELMFTPDVAARQARHGVRAGARLERAPADDQPDRLGGAEAAFIAERDSFIMATVGATGQPYVQHRGGPPGFLRVLDPGRLGFADFRGNRQYVSMGNLDGNSRVCLLLLDHAEPRRLKIVGRTRVLAPEDAPGLALAVRLPSYVAAVERVVEIAVEGLDWNCPQHIPRRFTLGQVEKAMAGLTARLRAVDAERDALAARLARLEAELGGQG